MKTCTKCNTEKSDTEFHWKDKAKGKLSSNCKTCQKEYQKLWYSRNRQGEIDRVRARTIRHRKWFKEYKSTLTCNRCSENDPVCLDFHHKNPDDKIDIIQNVISRGWSIERILTEIDKCEVLCANCHRKQHRKVYI